MTRYILKPAVNMYDCDFCAKEFKNGSSLASHRYRYHKNQRLGSNLQHSFDDGSEDEIHSVKRWKVDNQNSIVGAGISKYQSDESSNEGSSNEISDDTEASFEKTQISKKRNKSTPKLKKKIQEEM